MKKLVLAGGLFLLSLTTQPQAFGQTLYGAGGMGNYGPVSPYLNLNRPGAPLGVNYYNLVQPQMQFASQIGSLQQSTSMLQAGMLGGGMGGMMDTTGLYVTGHMAFFGNTMQFYPYRAGGMGGMGMGGMGMGGMGMGGMGRMGGGGMGMGGMGMGGMGMGGMGMGGGMGGMGMGMGGVGGMGGLMQNSPTRGLGRPPTGFFGSQGVR